MSQPLPYEDIWVTISFDLKGNPELVEYAERGYFLEVNFFCPVWIREKPKTFCRVSPGNKEANNHNSTEHMIFKMPKK